MNSVRVAKLLRKVSVLAATMKGTGLPRISSALWSRYSRQWTGGPIEISDFQGDMHFTCDLHEHMGSRIFWFDAYSGEELKLLQKTLKAGQVFIDIGANRGEFSLVAWKAVGPSGTVVSVEPVSSLRGNLQENIAANHALNIKVIDAAISDSEGQFDIFTAGADYEDGTRHDGLPTLFRSGDRGKVIETVRTTTLDTLVRELGLTRIDGIKMDIEGAELAALKGASQTLARFKPWIMCEIGENTCAAAGYTAQDLLDEFAKVGYSVAKIDGSQKTPIVSSAQITGWQNVWAVPVSQ